MEDTIRVVCGTILVLAMVGMVFFGFWSDYQIQKKHLGIERAKIQCQQCLEEKNEDRLQ